MTHFLRIGLVAIGLILTACQFGVGVRADYGNDHRWRRGGDRNYDHSYDNSYGRDRWGRIDGYPHVRYPRDIFNSLSVTNTDTPVAVDDVGTRQEQAMRLSEDYGLKEQSAVKIISLINSTNLQSDLVSMNLRTQDVAPLANLRMPTNASIRRMAAALHENEDAIATAIYDFISDIQAEDNH